MTTNDLNNLRHSCAHLLAAAVEQLYPKALKTIGPSIENGFYFDFDNLQISEADFPAIEAKMQEILKDWVSFEGREVDIHTAKKLFSHNPYKLELIDEFSKTGQKLTIYRSGDYEDLCRGGHIDLASQPLNHFKLLSVAGAYWRGDEKNKMLTRVYGTCWPTRPELEDYLNQLEEAKKRDHKKLGKELDLFTFSDLVGSGLPLWTPKGTLLRNLLDDFVWSLRQAAGYEKVEIPHITKKDLYEVSGHWDKFKDDLFTIETREGHHFAMKPMNCPHHTQIYAHLQRSYKDLPQRYATTTMVYRDEQSGELSGLSRVRCITQDDAHVFCRDSQIESEMLKIWNIVSVFYSSFGFDLKLRLSFSDPQTPEKYLGSKETWDKSESILKRLAESQKADYYIAPGEAAFYGPKLDFMAKDSLGRQWQVATIQLDRNMPERFDLYCINESSQQERIAMIHAAIMGSLERFLSILIEHFAGAFPVWLSPNQVTVIPISDKHAAYAQQVHDSLRSSGIRCQLVLRNDPLNSRIREAGLEKVPYIIVVGDKEAESHQVSVRKRGDHKSVSLPLSQFTDLVTQEITTKSLTSSI